MVRLWLAFACGVLPLNHTDMRRGSLATDTTARRNALGITDERFEGSLERAEESGKTSVADL